MERSYSGEEILISAATATTAGAGKPLYMSDWRYVVLTVVAEGGAVGATIKFKGSNMERLPTSWTSQDHNSRWSYVQVVDLSTNTAIDGATGVAPAVAGVQQYKVNAEALSYLLPEITAYTNGTIYVYARGYSND